MATEDALMTVTSSSAPFNAILQIHSWRSLGSSIPYSLGLLTSWSYSGKVFFYCIVAEWVKGHYAGNKEFNHDLNHRADELAGAFNANPPKAFTHSTVVHP